MIEVVYTLHSSTWSEYDPGEYITEFTGVIRAIADDIEDAELADVGEIRGFLIHVSHAREQGENLYEVFDDHSADFEAYYRVLFDKQLDDFRPGLLADPNSNTDILFVDDLIIYPGNRGKNIGLQALLNCIKTFGPGIGLVLMQSLPLQYHPSADVDEFKTKLGTDLLFTDKKIAMEKIQAHLSKIGFLPIQGTSLCVIDFTAWSGKDYQDQYVDGL
jgi:hypothetical protein